MELQVVEQTVIVNQIHIDVTVIEAFDDPLCDEEDCPVSSSCSEGACPLLQGPGPELIERHITDEVWREYDFAGRIYGINSPVLLHYREGGTTHRVTDVEGITHCVPAPGIDGCVLRWKSRDPNHPCAF